VNGASHHALDGVLMRLGRFCARRRLTVIGVWIAGLAAVLGLSGAIGGHFNDSFSIPGTPAQRAYDLMHERFPEETGASATVVFHAERGTLTDPGTRREVERAVAAAKRLSGVISVSDPYGLGSLAPDEAIAMATVSYRDSTGELGRPAAEELEDRVGAFASDGLQIAFGGSLVEQTASGGPNLSEQIGLAAAVLILLLAFGSVVAMGLPLVVALMGVAGGGAVVGLITLLTDVPVSAPQVATMIGLGVGIDYSIFVLSRHIENLRAGHEPAEAAGLALATSGHAVVVAGCTVVVALMGLLVVGIPLVTAIAVTSGATVIVMMLAALTLMPALLGLAGHRVTALRVPGRRRPAGAPGHSSFFDRWSRHVTRRAAIYLPLGLVVLVVLSAPLLAMRLGPQDAGSDPPGSTTREAFELISEGFGPGATNPLVLVAATSADASAADVGEDVARALTHLRSAPDVAAVLPPKFAPDHRAALVTLIPRSGADSPETPALVRDLRERVIPAATAGTGLQVEVGGVGASWVDLDDRVGGRMGPFILAVVGIAFLLLMLTFHSPFLAAKAAILNLLSIGAAYGVLVAVFQWGWGARLVGVDETMPIVAFVPLMMFAILFGLSMDYEVFILSRIREEYLRRGDTTEAVAHGLASTARLVTAAAAIMVAVFLAFVLIDDAVVKMVGLGLAVAVAVDATVTRMILLPATMRLAGRANWWEPRWLARILPPTTPTPADGARATPPRPAPQTGGSG
jgi:RND superfamily putative drug exporter